MAWSSVEMARRCEGKARQGDVEAGQSDVKARRGGGKAKQCRASEWNRPAEEKHGTDKDQQRLARAKLRKDGNGKARHSLAMAKHCPEREWKCEPITSNEEGYGRRETL